MVSRRILPCALLLLAASAHAESAPRPDVPGQEFPDQEYVEDPDTGPSAGIDTGSPSPQTTDTGSRPVTDTGTRPVTDTGSRPVADTGAPLAEAGPQDADEAQDLGLADAGNGRSMGSSNCQAIGSVGGAGGAWVLAAVAWRAYVSRRRGRPTCRSIAA